MAHSPTDRDLVTADEYRLDDQIGYLLRRANQHHTAIFSEHMPGRTTPTQFAAMARLYEEEPLSQNQLGRRIAVDAATIKGVVDRLAGRGVVQVERDPDDGRRFLVSLTPQGRTYTQECISRAEAISTKTLAPLEPGEAMQLVQLLDAMSGSGT